MECPKCGQWNAEGTLSCRFCNETLTRTRTGYTPYTPSEPLIGLSYSNQSPTGSFARQAAQARLFLLIAILWGLGLITPPLMCLEESLIPIRSYLSDPSMTPAVWAAAFGLGLFGLLYLAFLIGKTGQAIGASFLIPFALALLPPLWPAAWARVARRPLALPYLYLLIDAVLLTAAWQFNASVPGLFVGLLILLLPFLIYHGVGCSLVNLCNALGVNRYGAILWVCGAPYVLVILLLMTLGAEGAWDFILAARDPSAFWEALQGVAEGSPTLQSMTAIWLIVTVFVWLRAVYENLKFPMFA